MYAAYTHRSGRVAEIEYVANDDCRQIDTRQRYTLILLEAGSLTLDVGGHIRAFAAPCVLPVQVFPVSYTHLTLPTILLV